MKKAERYAKISFSAFILAALAADCIPALIVFMAIGIVFFALEERSAGK